MIANPSDPTWEPYTAPSLLKLSDAVITTPSTVAIDACAAGLPVAVVAYDLNLPRYGLLPLILKENDYFEFLSCLSSEEKLTTGN